MSLVSNQQAVHNGEGEGENGHHGRCPLSSIDSSQFLKQDLDLLAIGCALCNQVYALDYIISHFLNLQFIAPRYLCILHFRRRVINIQGVGHFASKRSMYFRGCEES